MVDRRPGEDHVGGQDDDLGESREERREEGGELERYVEAFADLRLLMFAYIVISVCCCFVHFDVFLYDTHCFLQKKIDNNVRFLNMYYF